MGTLKSDLPLVCHLLFKMASSQSSSFNPIFSKGVVIKGFGRGSKDLGIPTANFADEVISTLPKDMETGIYYGLANVDEGPIHKMVMSIGWNPYYKNVKKSMVCYFYIIMIPHRLILGNCVGN